MTSKKTLKSALESMMFVWGEPLEAKVAADVFNLETKEVYDALLELQDEYKQEGRGIEIRRVEKSFQFVTNPENFEYVQRLCTPVKKKKLTQSALEVLAIIAYRQPVTRGTIEAIRGIKSERVVDGLVKKDLVTEVGRSNAIGRPILYGTTKEFLKYMNIESIKDLPELDEGTAEVENVEFEESLQMHQITMDALEAEENQGTEKLSE